MARVVGTGCLQYTTSLYVPGCPVHPLTFISGVMDLLGIEG